MEKMTVSDIAVAEKRVLVRVDFNVPMNEKTGEITDDSRIKASLPTIKYLLAEDARVILMSHLGRPKGKVVESLRLAPVARRLSQILARPVKTVNDCIGPEVEQAASGLSRGEILMLENLRFHPEEEAGDDDFAKSLARLGEVFVNDAFGTSHRPHASISGITKYLPAVAGFLMEQEVETLGRLLEKPERPFAALLGGAKVSDKVAMIENIMGKVDILLIGGGMAATFLKAQSYEIGQSLLEADKLETAAKLINEAAAKKVHLHLPGDVLVAEDINEKAISQTVAVGAIPKNKRIVDIGPRTIKAFEDELRGCRTVFWNGPMGIYEIPAFSAGTRAMANMLAGLKASTIIGGGSTAEVVAEMKLTEKMTFVSTGGGASLEFLSGDKLPGVEALLDKSPQLFRRRG